MSSPTTSLSAPHPKRYNAGLPRTPTTTTYHPGQAQQDFRSSSPSTLNPYAQRIPNPDSPSSLTSSPQTQMSSKFTSSPSLSSNSPLLASSPTISGGPFDRISASDRDLTRYMDGDTVNELERKRADHRKTIQPHTFQKEQQYQQQRYAQSGRQDESVIRQKLASSPSQSYTSSSLPDSSPNASFRTTASPNIGSPASPQRSPAGPVNYGQSAERLELDALMRSAGDNQDRAIRKVLDERNSLAFQNAQLWKLIERERQKNTDLRAERDEARRRSAYLESRARDSEPGTARLEQSINSQRSTLRQEEDNSDPRRERQRANTVTEAMNIHLQRPVQPTRHHSDQQQQQQRDQDALNQHQMHSDRIMGEHNPFMLKMAIPRPFAGSHPSSPATYSLPDADAAGGLVQTPPIETISAPTSPAILNPEGTFTSMTTHDTQHAPNPMSSGRISETPGLLPSPPIGSIPPLGDRTFSEQTDSSLATPMSEEMPSVPAPPSSFDSKVTAGMLSESRPKGLKLNTSTEARADHYQQEVPRLTNGLLQHTQCSIPSSRVMPNATGKEVLCFIIKVVLRDPANGQTLSWSVGKMFSAFATLDNRIRSLLGGKKEIRQAGIVSLPESKSWKDFAPSKIDQRKAMLEMYLQSCLAAPIERKDDLCKFLTTDVMPTMPAQIAVSERASKSGYLTKRGKNLGGWKSRFFTLEGPLLHYYDKRGGNHLGVIPILGAEIGRQHKDSSTGPQDDKAYRHALLIIESRKPASGTTGLKHVLCAESDQERDAWVAELLVASNKPVDNQTTSSSSVGLENNPTSPLPRQSTSSSLVTDSRTSDQELQAQVSTTADTVPAPASRVIPPRPQAQSAGNSFSSSTSGNELSKSLPTTMEDPTIATMRDRSRQPGLTSKGSTPPQTTGNSPMKMKRQSAMPLRYQALTQEKESSHVPLSKVASSASGRINEMEAGRITRDMISGPSNGTPLPAGFRFGKDTNERERKAKSIRLWGFGGKVSSSPTAALKQVFGVPLQQALLVKSIANLPTPVFRCIKYLEAHHAEKEEGIYRIGGSQSVMHRLKERFNADGDIDLLANDEHWDIHAIAGLLKWYFRDLPVSVLDDQQTAFVQTMDLIDDRQRIQELARLVSLLPVENYSLLRALCSHLILIIQHSEENKMTLRNVSIILAPTIGVNGGTLSSFLMHFRAIFDGAELPEAAAADASIVESSESAATISPQTQHQEENPIGDAPQRNRNSRIYAEASEQILGMGGRELDNQDEESEADYAGTEESCGDSEADVTAKQIAKSVSGERLSTGMLTPSSSFNNPENGLRNIPRSPRMDWAASMTD